MYGCGVFWVFGCGIDSAGAVGGRGGSVPGRDGGVVWCRALLSGMSCQWWFSRVAKGEVAVGCVGVVVGVLVCAGGVAELFGSVGGVAGVLAVVAAGSSPVMLVSMWGLKVWGLRGVAGVVVLVTCGRDRVGVVWGGCGVGVWCAWAWAVPVAGDGGVGAGAGLQVADFS